MTTLVGADQPNNPACLNGQNQGAVKNNRSAESPQVNKQQQKVQPIQTPPLKPSMAGHKDAVVPQTPMLKFLKSMGIDVYLSGHNHYTLKAAGFMDLIVETWHEKDCLKISVCHYGEQNGDLMQDPEIVYKVNNNTPEYEMPIYYRNAYLGVEQEVFPTRDGVLMVNPGLLNDLKTFTKTWIENLKAQGHKLVEQEIDEIA